MLSEEISNQDPAISVQGTLPSQSSLSLHNASLTNQDDSSSNSLISDLLTSSIPLPQPPENPANTVPSKTLWMGDLEAWWDENYIASLWEKMDKHVEVKVIKPKHNLLMHQLAKTNGQGIVNHSGYCFIEFDSPDLAKDALSLNGTNIPDTPNKTFRLNWASAATLDSQVAQTPEYSLFVGDLSTNTTEAHLLALFQSHFNSIKTVRVMTDPSSGLSRCFGFVRFSNEDDRQRALNEMNGKWLGGRQIRVALASPKHQHTSKVNNNGNANYHNYNEHGNPQMDQSMFVNPNAGPVPNSQMGYYSQFSPNNGNKNNNYMNNMNDPINGNSANRNTDPNFNDLNNTTVFVGGLANGLNENVLGTLFEPFGTILNIKVPPGKGCGFVKFANRTDAENAIEGMQGFVIGGSRVRLSWGRTSNKSHPKVHHPLYQQNMHNMNNMNNMSNMSNMNNMRFNNMMGATGSFPNSMMNQQDLNNAEFNDSVSTMADPMINAPIFKGKTHQGQPIMARAIYDYGQGMLQPGPGNVAPVLSPNQIPQPMVETYAPDGTPQGTHATLVGIPAGMPPPFIYDPYYNGNMNAMQGGENQGMPPPPPQAVMNPGSSAMMEAPNGLVSFSGPPHMSQQYTIDQNGRYIYVPPMQQFPPNQIMSNSSNIYDDNTSESNTNNE